MGKIFISLLFITLSVFGQNGKKQLCKDRVCGKNMSCKVDKGKERCICNSDYTLSKDKKSCINEKEVNCLSYIPPKNSKIVKGKVTVHYKNSRWSKADKCEWVCKKGYILEDGKCINRKKVKCSDIEPPDNGKQIDKQVGIFYDGTKWSTPKGCKWECNSDYTLSKDKKSCINEKEVNCLSYIPPKNSKIVKGKVTVHYKNSRWSKADKCEWVCKKGYILEDGKCINRKKVVCGGLQSTDHPQEVDNKIQVLKKVTINFDGSQWSKPKSCGWRCKNGYTWEGDRCINSKEVLCKKVIIPKNGVEYRDNVTISYNGKRWSDPKSCKWGCKKGYILENGKCINRKKVKCSNIKHPKNSYLIKKDVEIFYKNISGWSEPKKCNWRCKKDYISEDGENCIHKKKVSCQPIKPPKNGIQIDKDLYITYSSKWGWSKPNRCDWRCKKDYTYEKGRCIHKKKVTCKPKKPPKHAKLVWSKLEVEYSSESGWSKPDYCGWRCDRNYITEDDEKCISSKMEKCRDIEYPENGHLVDKFYRVYYSSKWGWGKTPKCKWECDKDYISENGKTCIHKKDIPCIDITPPKFSKMVKKDVSIFYKTGKGWSKPDLCKWHCIKNYYVNGQKCLPYGKKLSIGGDYSCVLKYDGTVRCWGANSYGQLGNGDNKNSKRAVKVRNLDKVIQLESGWGHSCALLEDRTVKCWGDNRYGQVGDGTFRSKKTAVKVKNLSNVKKIALGWKHSCALLNNGYVKCWGRNKDNQLGDKIKGDHNKPYKNIYVKDVIDVTAGGFHTCVIYKNREAQCWGFNKYGQLGDGTNTTRTQPTNLLNSPKVKKIISGDFHNCLLSTNNEYYCWGLNDFGQLGNGTIINYPKIEKLKIKNLKKLKLGWKNSLAYSDDGKFLYWGRSYQDGVKKRLREPLTIYRNRKVIDFDTASKHQCILFQNGKVACQGINDDGELGTGDTKDRLKFSDVLDPK